VRILFIGSTLRGYLSLKALIDAGAEIAGVISLQQDEHEVQRYEVPIQELAQSRGIPHYLTQWMKDRDYPRWLLNEIRPDIAFVIGCRILIPPEIYGIPPLGTLAVHDSLLPRYRGFAPLNWSILNGETETGVTLFYLDERMDGGDIVLQKSVPIGPRATAAMVYELVCKATVDVLLEAYPALVSGTSSRTPQDYQAGSFTCSRTPADGEIAWNQPTREIFNKIRALAWPYPGAFTFYETRKLTVWQAVPVEDAPDYAGRIPGRVIAVSKSTGTVDVLTGDGVLRILEVQHSAEEKTPAAVAIRSIRTTLGLHSSELLARIAVLEDSLRGAEAKDESGQRSG
jgi:methionyl-tRNA formyltransferase